MSMLAPLYLSFRPLALKLFPTVDDAALAPELAESARRPIHRRGDLQDMVRVRM